jgi:hypothetical protein
VRVTTILALIEQPLHPHDVERLAAFYAPDPATVHVVAATVPEGGRIARIVDEAATAGQFPDESAPEAALDASLASLRAAGVEADGELAGRDTVASVVEAATTVSANEVWVITPTHWLEETFHQDWANKLRETLKIPVLHIVSGTDRVVS